MTPNFDEIVGAESPDGERERLRQVHELLLLAGPPPELTPRLARTPSTGSNVVSLPRLPVKRRATLLFAAAFLVLVVFLGGYSIGQHRAVATQPLSTYKLRGTAVDPQAHASLTLFRAAQGNWPMTLQVTGLRALPQGSHYEVYLVRNGKPWGSCGTFVVDSSSGTVSVRLNAPYQLRRGDTWIVTREGPGKTPATTVLKPV